MYIHEPHSMQSITPLCRVFSHSLISPCAAIRKGSRPIGHTSTQLPQRMQGWGSGRRLIRDGSTSMPDMPLVVGVSRYDMARPIMGPPATTLPVSSGNPPAASIRAETGVPMSVRKLPGLARSGPVTVTTRRVRGSPFSAASQTANAVATLSTMAPT